MTGAQKPDRLSTKQRRIAEVAQQRPDEVFTSLAHLIDESWLHQAYHQVRKDGAVGVDGMDSTAYEADREANLRSLLDRAKSGTYVAPPVRRVRIPKPGSTTETRPLGIPTFEDKVLQKAVALVLETVYEQDFLDCSYGFRPGRSAHQALAALWRQTMDMGGGWILEVDIRKFFDTIDHGQLREVLKRRVRDGVLLRLIGKWLNAGALEDGNLTFPEAGTPQGGVISPLLANIFLHTVLDDWFERQVRPRLKGHAFLVRYADDLLMGFAHEEDARRVLAVLPKRFEKYGLALHPEKARLVPFERPTACPTGPDQPSRTPPGTFDLLGFTHYWGRTRKGGWAVKRKTSKSRYRRGLRAISEWCRGNRHQPIADQHRTLSQKLRGHFAYYGITGNSASLARFRHAVIRIWRKWLSRRRRGMFIAWDRMNRLLERYALPVAVAIHSVCRRPANA
jgi:group II intron reverse transcriptase/maturase